MRSNMALFLEMNGALSGGRGDLMPLTLPRKRFSLNALRHGLRGLLQGDAAHLLTVPLEGAASKERRFLN